jgi:hypothetical protein
VRVGEECVIDDVGEASLQDPDRFEAAAAVLRVVGRSEYALVEGDEIPTFAFDRAGRERVEGVGDCVEDRDVGCGCRPRSLAV